MGRALGNYGNFHLRRAGRVLLVTGRHHEQSGRECQNQQRIAHESSTSEWWTASLSECAAASNFEKSHVDRSIFTSARIPKATIPERKNAIDKKMIDACQGCVGSKLLFIQGRSWGVRAAPRLPHMF